MSPIDGSEALYYNSSSNINKNGNDKQQICLSNLIYIQMLDRMYVNRPNTVKTYNIDIQ